MEYLVTMTTRVPDGTPEEAVKDIRAREAARSGQLATEGHLLRLWRPPLQPGEWRTLGLFSSNDDSELEKTLASMPLRVWRTDEVTPLSPHPNDPARHSAQAGTGASEPEPNEFLTTFTVAVPADAEAATVDATFHREADRARDLAENGVLERLWALPGSGRTLGLWHSPDSAAMNAVLESLPLYGWMRTDITPLSPHPSDPARASG